MVFRQGDELTLKTGSGRDINAAKNILQIGLKEQLFLGAGRPKVKPLENTLSKRGSVKEETQRSLAFG